MVGKTIKEIFKAVNDMNNAMDVLSTVGNRSEVVIYIDDMKVYQGNSFKEFSKTLRKEYIKTFYEQIMNIMFCGNYSATVKDEIINYKSIVEVFIWDKGE